MVAKPRHNHCGYMAFRRANQPSKSITQHDCVILLDETLKHRICSLAVLVRHKPKCPKWFQMVCNWKEKSCYRIYKLCPCNDNINAVFYTIVNGTEINRAGERSSVLKLIQYHDTRISLLGFTLRDQISTKCEQTYSEDTCIKMRRESVQLLVPSSRLRPNTWRKEFINQTIYEKCVAWPFHQL